MGEAKRRKSKDSNFGKVSQKLNKGSFNISFNSLREFVEYSTAEKGRGYLVYAMNKCLYLGKDDYVGSEDEILLKSVQSYNLYKEVVLVRKVKIPLQDWKFDTSIIPIEELNNIHKGALKITKSS